MIALVKVGLKITFLVLRNSLVEPWKLYQGNLNHVWHISLAAFEDTYLCPCLVLAEKVVQKWRLELLSAKLVFHVSCTSWYILFPETFQHGLDVQLDIFCIFKKKKWENFVSAIAKFCLIETKRKYTYKAVSLMLKNTKPFT